MADAPNPTPDSDRSAKELNQFLNGLLYRGKGVPRGDGKAVLVIPGLFGNTLYIAPMYTWLRTIGYEPMGSTLALQGGCPERISREVEAALTAYLRGRSRRVAFIGHSHGGVIGRVVAARLGRQVSHLILLGAPVAAFVPQLTTGTAEQPPPPATREIFDAGIAEIRARDPDCRFPTCNCPFPNDLRRGPDSATKALSIYSTLDPIISEWACKLDGARNVPLEGSHVGLVFNERALRAVAGFLSGKA